MFQLTSCKNAEKSAKSDNNSVGITLLSDHEVETADTDFAED